MGDPDEDTESLALDLAHRLAVDDDARAVHPLHHRTHADIMPAAPGASARGPDRTRHPSI
ncbi:hypothetical protein ACE1SV_29920 [Streptomyces sp. E-15]